MVLGVERHGGAGLLGGGTDLPCVIEGDLLAVGPERLPDGTELDAHLDARLQRSLSFGQSVTMERGQHLAVGRDDRFGLRPVGGVLTQMVERDRQVVLDERARGLDGRVGRRAADVAAHDVA